MTTRIQLKRSNEIGDTPPPEVLAAGELAINTADSRLFHKDEAGDVVELGIAPADRQKLAGIATGATANSADTHLLSREYHTGTQAISTVTGLQTSLDDKAPLASPNFTDTPTAPTAPAGTDTTQIATTAFVAEAIESATFDGGTF